MKLHSFKYFALALALQFQSHTASALEPFAVTEGELAQMPQYCQAKQGKDRGNQAIIDKWRGIYGDQNWLNMHHYCDALKFIVRANKSLSNKADLRYNLEQAGRGIEHLLTVEQTPDWILRPEAHVNLGKVYLRLAQLGRGSEGKAIQNFEEAKLIQPNYEPAYSALSDYYADKGLKQKALSVIEDGLKQSPDSKQLLRRFKALGGKTPPAPLIVTRPVVPDEANNSPVKQVQPELESTPSALPSDMPASSSKQEPEKQTYPPNIGSPSNPWCRFCPDTENTSPVKGK
jgi:tetratricopeptide (TPR) repeat protein